MRLRARLSRHIRIASERVNVSRTGRPVVGVLSGIGDDNFGDEWMAEALAEGLAPCRLVPVELPATEARLERIGLSGPRFFDGLVVSGGTLLNPYFLGRVEPLLLRGIPMWTTGTGVGSAGFGVSEERADPSAWLPYLARFEAVTLRGPLSQARLGLPQAQVVGDLALWHTPEEPPRRPVGRRVAHLNVSGTASEDRAGIPASRTIDAGVAVVQQLRADGWRCHALEVHRDDAPLLQRVGEAIGGWDGEGARLRTGADVEQFARGSDLVVAMRLHAAAVGWMWGIPTLALGYRDKNRDFARQLGVADRDLVDLREAGPAEAREAVARAAADGTTDPVIRERALASRDLLRTHLAAIREHLAR